MISSSAVATPLTGTTRAVRRLRGRGNRRFRSEGRCTWDLLVGQAALTLIADAASSSDQCRPGRQPVEGP